MRCLQRRGGTPPGNRMRTATRLEPLHHLWSSESSLPSTGVKRLSTTKSAILRPRRWPVVRSERKCTPAKIRLSVASSAAEEKLVKEHFTPGRTSEVTVKSKRWSLKKEISTKSAPALM